MYISAMRAMTITTAMATMATVEAATIKRPFPFLWPARET
jgi:hypothetical protein